MRLNKHLTYILKPITCEIKVYVCTFVRSYLFGTYTVFRSIKVGTNNLDIRNLYEYFEVNKELRLI